MAKAQKKNTKKPVKKIAKNTAKPAKKQALKKPVIKKPAAKKPVAKKPVIKKPAAKKPVIKKPAVKKIMVRTIMPGMLQNKKMFAMEITLLDKIQAELFDAIAAKPAVMDIEETRLFVDNVYMTMNKCVTIAKDVKNMILNKDFKEPITETYNSPA